MRMLKQTRGNPAGKGSHSLLKGPKAGDDNRGKSGKLTSTKNKIRGVERLLRKAGLDYKLKRSLDAKLSELNDSLNRHNQEETERKFAIRYHKIRFFERVKLERRIKQLKGKAQRGHALSATEQHQLQKWEQELQYVLHFPKGERYVSILKEVAEPEAQAKLDAERTRLKAVIKHQLAESAMLTEADEGLGHAELLTKAKADAEGDAFFLDSNDDSSDAQSAGEAPAVSAKPAAAEAVTHRKRSHGEITASQALNSLPQQAQTGMAQQVQRAKAQHARNNVGLQADGATPLVGPFEQPAAKRQALAGSAHINRDAANRVMTSIMADERGRGSTQQHAGKNPLLAVQRSTHAVQHSAQAQPMREFTCPAKASEKRDQSAREDALGGGKHSRAVSAVNQAASEQLRTSAASRSQLLLRQLQQKYATSQQPSRPDVGRKGLSLKSFDHQSKDLKPPPSELEASCRQFCNIARPKLVKPAVGRLTPVSESRHNAAAPRVTGVVPMRTRAQGGRWRRK